MHRSPSSPTTGRPFPTGFNRLLIALGLTVYAVVFVVVARRWDLPPIGFGAALLLTTALAVGLGAKALHATLFRGTLRRVGHPVTRRAAMTASLIATAVARLVPAGAALSPVALAWAVRAEDEEAFGAALRTAVVSYGGLLLLAGLALGLVAPTGVGPFPTAGALTTAAIVVAIGASMLVGSRWLGRLIRLLPDRLRRRFGPAGDGPSVTVDEMGLIASRLGLEATVLWMALSAFDVDLDIGQTALAYGTTAVIGGLPITPGGIGLVEGGMVGMLVSFGFAAEAVVAPVLVYRIIDYWIMAAIGVYAAGRVAGNHNHRFRRTAHR